MATIKKKLAKKQDGGPADAMRKAMGQKPTSTKETLKYVSKHGSGYLPPIKKDTANPNAQSIKKPKAQLGAIVKGIKTIGKVFNRVNKAPGGTTAIGGALATGIAAAAKGGKKPVAKKPVVKKKK